MKIHRHQLEVFAGVGQAERAVDRAIAGLWRELLAIMRTTEGPARDYERALAVLRRVGPVSHELLRNYLAKLYRVGFDGAANVVLRTMRRPVREREEGLPDPLAMLFNLFAPPNERAVMAWLDRFIRPEQYRRVGTDNDKRLPEELAQQFASDVSLGKSQFEIAKGLRPFLDGSRMRARRAARTFGGYVAGQGQLQAWEQVPDVVKGYTVHAALDRWTRPAHRARNGTTYWRHPGPGQLGFDAMPHPPREADGSMAWNCRCYLTPKM